MLERIIFFLIVLFAADTKPNLFLGAGGFGYGCGSNSPYAQRPFSYVRLGPDTTPNIKKIDFSFQHYGGYSTAD
jgi:putative alpha-1,2-mannosidase